MVPTTANSALPSGPALATHHAALRRVATAVARTEALPRLFVVACEEAARLLGGDVAAVSRFTAETTLTIVGCWGRSGDDPVPAGTKVEMRPGPWLQELRATGRPIRVAHAPGDETAAPGLRCATTVNAPVLVGERLWGTLSVAFGAAEAVPTASERQLAEFAELVALAVVNADNLATLAARASTDSLTGLANQRTFAERLAEEVARAAREGTELTLAVIDMDHFKEVNDRYGDHLGDDLLAQVARRVEGCVRAYDILGRLGGDQFGLLLPGVDRLEAYRRSERIREEIAGGGFFNGISVTASVGVCDLRAGGNAEGMVRLADGALYWGKAHGRNVTWIYDPDVIRELSAQERAEHLEREQALSAMRALARAIDAKDPVTREHSERVAALAGALAREMAWPAERVAMLCDAALVHDVGKIGVPDSVLMRPGPLTAGELGVVKRHAELGAGMVAVFFGDEQVAWVREHHERQDGRGYPQGLAAGQITEGAEILTLADSFDVMTVSRPYGNTKGTAQAVAECRALAGRQFASGPVGALEALHARGGLSVALAGAQPAPPPASAA